MIDLETITVPVRAMGCSSVVTFKDMAWGSLLYPSIVFVSLAEHLKLYSTVSAMEVRSQGHHQEGDI
jgi:hypothetical protein